MGDRGWVALRWPGEVGDAVLFAGLQVAAELAEDVDALTVRRAEASPSGTREVDVVRIARAGALGSLPEHPDQPVPIVGRIAALDGQPIGFDRARLRDASGLASRREATSDWLGAAQAWALAGDGRSPWSAWARLREAVAIGVLHPTALSIGRTLAEAWGDCPGLIEAPVRLAGHALGRGRVDDASRFFAAADALRGDLADVPQPHGAGTWFVPWIAARWLAQRDPAVAQVLARRARERGVTGDPLSRLLADVPSAT